MASSAKHFINDPTVLVNTALRAITYTNPAVALDEEHKIIYRLGSKANGKATVSVVSGGGSGHEPSFASMVGAGLLTAAVAGTIFASPSTEQVRTAVAERVPGEAGVLVTVMNYTGDVLNFGVAVEKARAAGVAVEMVVVGDDVGVGRAKAGKVGRRGIAGTVLVHKVSGAAAARGLDLTTVARLARLAATNLVSVGASLEHVHVPGREPPNAAEGLTATEVEIGMGIHNEPGSGRASGLALPALVGTLLRQLLDTDDADRAFLSLPAGSTDVVLMVNNLGGVSVLELGGITAEVVRQLAANWQIRPVRVLSGTYMTSLNGLGFSISLLHAGVDTGLGPDGPSLLQLLDDPAEVTGWATSISAATWNATWDDAMTSANKATAPATSATTATATAKSGLYADPAMVRTVLERGLQRVVAAEPEITHYDTIVGDGDCGTGMKRGAEAVLQHLATGSALTGDVVADVAGIVPVVEGSMDGTSGALYAIFLNALVHALRQQASGGQKGHVNWAAALRQSCDALSRYTPARPGDRTLVDALYPFVAALEKTGGDVGAAAAAARAGAESTKGMQASLGRTVYVGGSGFEKVPDPGAWGLACFFGGLSG
ncbi:dihydroxyacetone kinase [Grosmannia clavigera kw1407]|uniref:Dihydroxyacetone kinase n=1 Tax=Grosmannia clavigera (strain kw1407 / UAMH 11150) TaxID=655863 RepID=F0XEA2_GROCL|nr:dihydroxyacetone kinase [Grosmannia clavigera kw1407]EFX04314.1 dihydroxyacetone kinase [Grosmannia clavigera kw1407]